MKLVNTAVNTCVLGACLLALTVNGASAEAKKISATGKASTVLSLTKMSPGDTPKHEVSLIRRLDTDVCSDPAFGTLQVNTLNFSDYIIGGTGVQQGYRIAAHTSGDQTFSAYEGTTQIERGEDGKARYSFSGKWWYTGGTGQFKGITGGGTYKGRLTPEGVVYEWEGSYELPSEPAKASK